MSNLCFNPVLRAGYGRGLSDQLKTLPYYAKFNLGGSDMLVRGLDPSAAGPYYVCKTCWDILDRS